MFNWAHWLVGNVAYILAVCAVFMAVDLKSAALPAAVTTVMIVYVVIHAVFHMVLTVQKVVAVRGQKNVHDVATSHGHGDSDMSGSSFRKLTLVLYMAFVWAAVIALIVYIFTSKSL